MTKTIRSSSMSAAPFWDKPYKVVAPNGVTTDYTYDLGTWDPVGGVFTPNGFLPTGSDIAEYATQAPLVHGKSLRTVNVKVAGQTVLNTVLVWDYSFGPNGQNSSQPAAWLLISSEETRTS